jgi:hypothetical protein
MRHAARKTLSPTREPFRCGEMPTRVRACMTLTTARDRLASSRAFFLLLRCFASPLICPLPNIALLLTATTLSCVGPLFLPPCHSFARFRPQPAETPASELPQKAGVIDALRHTLPSTACSDSQSSSQPGKKRLFSLLGGERLRQRSAPDARRPRLATLLPSGAGVSLPRFFAPLPPFPVHTPLR